MNSIMDNLTKALDMNPLVVEEQKEEQLPVVVEETNDAEQDFELARKNLQELCLNFAQLDGLESFGFLSLLICWGTDEAVDNAG